MDYKEKVIALLNSQELSKEQKEKLEEIFPELKESEDEKIRKVLLNDFKNNCSEYYCEGVNRDMIIAWLEKQGEQKSANKVEPKFKVGDYIERKDGLGCHAKIIFVGENVYGCEKLIHSEDSFPFVELMFKNQDEFRISSDFQQNLAWSEEDERLFQIVIDILDRENHLGNLSHTDLIACVRKLKSLKDRVLPQPKQDWKQENTQDLTDFENTMMHIGRSFFGEMAGLDPNDTNAIKEQANLLLELVPKQEWSN